MRTFNKLLRLKPDQREQANALGPHFSDLTTILTTAQSMKPIQVLEELEYILERYASQALSKDSGPVLANTDKLRDGVLVGVKELLGIWEIWLARAVKKEGSGSAADDELLRKEEELRRFKRQSVYLTISLIFRGLDAFKQQEEMIKTAERYGLLDKGFDSEVRVGSWLETIP